jgi:hypothetical protein
LRGRGYAGTAVKRAVHDIRPGSLKLAQAAEKSWNRLRGYNQLPKVIIGVKFKDGIEVVKSQAQAAAA